MNSPSSPCLPFLKVSPARRFYHLLSIYCQGILAPAAAASGKEYGIQVLVLDILRVHSCASDAPSLHSSFLIFLPVCVHMSQPTDCRSVCLMGIEDLIHS